MSTDRFEVLWARASARSLDLKQLAGEASKDIPASSPRRRKMMEDLYGGPIRETVAGKHSRTTSRGGFYPQAQLAHSLGGLIGPKFLAAMYSFAMDASVRPLLFLALRERAAQIARNERWPESIPGVNGSTHHYHDALTAMVLDVDWLKPLFDQAQDRGVNLYAIAMDAPEPIWHARLKPLYERIKCPYDIWLAQARGHIERKLAEEFQREGVANERMIA